MYTIGQVAEMFGLPDVYKRQQNECPSDVIRKAELRRAHHRLKRPDGARARGSRTRVAVEPRHADGFARPLVDASLGKVGQMNVGRERRRRLNQSAESRQKARYGVYSCLLYTSRCV